MINNAINCESSFYTALKISIPLRTIANYILYLLHQNTQFSLKYSYM